MEKWVLVKDDKIHWHYEKIVVEDPKPRCCQFIDEERECLDCVKEGGPEAGGVVRWHSAFYCPFCRGEGVPVKRNEV
jgi:hypothetical protein